MSARCINLVCLTAFLCVAQRIAVTLSITAREKKTSQVDQSITSSQVNFRIHSNYIKSFDVKPGLIMMSKYRKIPNISPGFIYFQGHSFGGAQCIEDNKWLEIIFAIAFFKYAIIDQRRWWACTRPTHYRTRNTKVTKFIKLADTRSSFSLRVVVPTPLSPRGKGT